MPRVVWIGAAVLMLAAASDAGATDLRGRVDGKNNFSSALFPVGGAALQLYREEAGQRKLAASGFTAPDGMYYFRGIAPGSYVLQVQGRKFQVQVSHGRLQDIPPVVIPR